MHLLHKFIKYIYATFSFITEWTQVIFYMLIALGFYLYYFFIGIIVYIKKSNYWQQGWFFARYRYWQHGIEYLFEFVHQLVTTYLGKHLEHVYLAYKEYIEYCFKNIKKIITNFNILLIILKFIELATTVNVIIFSNNHGNTTMDTYLLFLVIVIKLAIKTTICFMYYRYYLKNPNPNSLFSKILRSNLFFLLMSMYTADQITKYLQLIGVLGLYLIEHFL